MPRQLFVAWLYWFPDWSCLVRTIGMHIMMVCPVLQGLCGRKLLPVRSCRICKLLKGYGYDKFLDSGQRYTVWAPSGSIDTTLVTGEDMTPDEVMEQVVKKPYRPWGYCGILRCERYHKGVEREAHAFCVRRRRASFQWLAGQIF